MRKSDWAKWLIVIPAMLGIVLVTYVDRITDIWGFGAFICQLIAILELAYGMRIAMLAQSRKKSYRLTPEERHEYAQYLSNHYYDASRIDTSNMSIDSVAKEIIESIIR